MKRIAISLKKEYWQEILRGDKQIEFRKYAPTTDEKEPFLAIVHVSGTYAWQGVIFFFGAEKGGEKDYRWIARVVAYFDKPRPMAYYRKKNGDQIRSWPQTFIEIAK